MIPFLDLKAAVDALQPRINEAVARVLASGYYIGGPEVAAFEEKFARYCEAKYAVGMGNGLDALRFALEAMDVGPGDEVIVPSHTYIASWLAVSQVGATPVPVEPEPGLFTIDPAQIEAAITPRTRVIMPVHLYGQSANMGPIMEIAKRHGLRVLEDAAQAQGAKYAGRRVGAVGDVVAWSFYPGKNLGALGDGGAITTDDADLADRIRMLGNYGSRVKYDHQTKGANSRLDPIQAAVLSVKLEELDAWNARRNAVADLYSTRLADLPLGLPHVPQWADPVWHLYVVRTDHRDALIGHLTQAGVQTLLHYPKACFDQPAYAEFADRGADWPQAREMAAQVVSLPSGPHMSLDDAEHVAQAVIDFYAGLA